MISSANMFRVVAVITGRCDRRVIGTPIVAVIAGRCDLRVGGAPARLRAPVVVARASVATDASLQVIGAMGCGFGFSARSDPHATRSRKFGVAFGEENRERCDATFLTPTRRVHPKKVCYQAGGGR